MTPRYCSFFYLPSRRDNAKSEFSGTDVLVVGDTPVKQSHYAEIAGADYDRDHGKCPAFHKAVKMMVT